MKKILVSIIVFLILILTISFVLGSFGLGNKEISDAPIGKTVEIKGQSLRYIEAGEGQDVLLIHGTPGSIEDMQLLFDSLSKDHHVIAYDRPGHGFSSAHNIPRNLEHNANIVRGLIDHFNLDSALVIGHSYGGCISMKMAVEGIEEVERFIILGSPLFSFNSEFIYDLFTVPLLRTSLSWLVSGWYAGSKIRDELPQRFGPNTHIANEDFVDFRVDLWSQPKVILSKSLETVNIQDDLDPIIPQYRNLKNPVSIVIGDDDDPHYKTDLLKYGTIPKAEVIFYPNTGHFVQLEKTDAVLDLIRSY